MYKRKHRYYTFEYLLAMLAAAALISLWLGCTPIKIAEKRLPLATKCPTKI